MPKLILGVTLGLFAVAGAAVPADARVLRVGEAYEGFASIRAALNAASPGDTIRVEAGTYPGVLVIDKPVVLEGVERPVIRGTGKGSVLLLLAGGCKIRGFVIERSGGDLQSEDSGILLKSSDNVVEDNELRDVLYGIYFYHSERNQVRGNVIRGRSELDLGERGAGLHLWNSPNNRLERNTISVMRDGLYIQSSPGNIIRHNRVFDLRYGVHYMFSDGNVFEDNIFSRNVAGAAIMYSKKIEFRRNAFLHNRGFSSFGILFQDCDECLAENNHIIDNATGIFMEALRKSTFCGNVIAQNDVALQMFSSAEENTFSGNNFVENLSSAHIIGRRTTTRWIRDGRGNYWSDYDGYDLDGDGIGDVPHRIQNVFEYLEGNYPRLRLYLNSPAAQALAMAEKAFPVIQGSQEADEAPLARAALIRFPFGPHEGEQARPVSLAAGSLGMLLTALILMWKARRK